MSKSNTKTLLPLDKFARLVGLHPLHFNQIELPSLEVTARTCGLPIFQYSWQMADRIGREDIAEAIATAEANICRQLGYKLLPQWERDELTLPYGDYAAIRTDWKYVLYGGVEAKTLILNRPIVYTDVDTDGYFETATITCATTVTNTDEIALYYPGKLGADEYEIRPLVTTITGGVATITLRREQLLLEAVLEDMIDPRAIDGVDNGQFLTTIDVYRHYNDPQTQVEFRGFQGCCTSGCTKCQYWSQTGCLNVLDSRNGIIAPSSGTWNATTTVFDSACMTYRPARAIVQYYAGRGYKQSKVLLAPEWERAIAYYALTLLDRPLCKCNAFGGFSDHWKQDLAKRESGQNNSVSFASRKFLDCPLGTTRGALNAWRLVQQEMVGQAL